MFQLTFLWKQNLDIWVYAGRSYLTQSGLNLFQRSQRCLGISEAKIFLGAQDNPRRPRVVLRMSETSMSCSVHANKFADGLCIRRAAKLRAAEQGKEMISSWPCPVPLSDSPLPDAAGPNRFTSCRRQGIRNRAVLPFFLPGLNLQAERHH